MRLAADAASTVGLVAFAGTALLGPDGVVSGFPGWGRERRRRHRSAQGSASSRSLRSPGYGQSRSPSGRSDGWSLRSGRETARWARPSDLGRLVVGTTNDGEPPPPGRLALGTVGRRRLASEKAQSVIVFGPTQSHKTSGFAVPAILDWQGPVVAASVKTDLVEHTIDHRRLIGAVQCFDPSGSTGLPSAHWSPLPEARTWPGARRAAAAMTEVARTSVGTMADADFWYAAAARLLAPLLFAAAVGGGDMDDVVRWVATQEESDVLALLGAVDLPEAIHAALSSFGKEERQRSSIYTTLEAVLEPFGCTAAPPGRLTDDGGYRVPADGRPIGGGPIADGSGAGRSVDGGTVDPAVLVGGSNTLYLCAPAHDQRRLTPLFASVVRSVVEHVYDRVTLTRNPLDPPLLVVLDEAANIAPLSDLDGLAATAAGHGVQLVTIWHDMAQINARYGLRSTTVVNNHRAKLFLSGISDPSTLDYASHLIGEEEVSLPARTHGGRGGPSTTHSPTVRRLASADSLRRIPPGEAVLVYGDLAPARLRLRPWYTDRRQRSSKEPHRARPQDDRHRPSAVDEAQKEHPQ